MDDSRRELETALKLTPDDFRTNLVFGRMLVLQDKSADALAPLKKAAKLQPSDPNPHLFLADAYARLGQKANAEREHQEAERLRAPAKP
jgi:Flp pilus assembly protein TadD